MQIPRALHVACALLLVSPLISARPALAANYPLELTNIREGLSARSRITRAYPGLEYNIRAAVVGGAYPFTFSLANAPAGMTINARTGEITWPDPRANATPTIVVVDAEGTRVSATWTIQVGGAGFRFIDAVNGRNAEGNGCTSDCGAGTAERPWRTMSDMYRSRAAGELVYFKNGTYGVTDLPRTSVGSPWERVEFVEGRHPVVWMAYPGQTPVIDFAAGPGAEVRPIIRLRGDNVYVDGFETRSSHLIAFQFVSGPGNGPTFRRLRMHTHGPGVDGANAAFIMTTTSPQPSDGMVIQDCEFSNVTGESVTLKIYAQRKLLIENTTHFNATVAIELKDDVRQFSVRGNTLHDIERTGIGGNMHKPTTHGEIVFNNVRAGLALDLNQNGLAGPIHVYRNTFVGRVQVRNTDSSDGPFYLSHNVIVSRDGGSRVHHYEVTDRSRIILSDNLTESPSRKVVDAGGNLTAAYSRYLGTHGHQLAAAPPSTRPRQ
ncbi:MAG: Ig domain-containing protein [Vicinamibacterales bacterium]